MKKYLVMREMYSADIGWESEAKVIKTSLESANKYCKENIVEDLRGQLEYDISIGADDYACNELIKELDKGWESFKSNKEVETLMDDNDYDFGYGGEDYEFGYGGYDGDQYSIRYKVYEVEEEE